jgi:hypothetical protein
VLGSDRGRVDRITISRFGRSLDLNWLGVLIAIGLFRGPGLGRFGGTEMSVDLDWRRRLFVLRCMLGAIIFIGR